MTIRFADLSGYATEWEVDGCELSPIRYDAPISREEAQRCQKVIAFCACMECMASHTNWRHPRPEPVTA